MSQSLGRALDLLDLVAGGVATLDESAVLALSERARIGLTLDVTAFTPATITTALEPHDVL